MYIVFEASRGSVHINENVVAVSISCRVSGVAEGRLATLAPNSKRTTIAETRDSVPSSNLLQQQLQDCGGHSGFRTSNELYRRGVVFTA